MSIMPSPYLLIAQLNDPGSMKTYRTSIWPVSTDGTHTILVSFGARNSFGGMVRSDAVGSIDNKTCKATLSYTISLGWGHKVCWKKLDVVFNPAPSGK